MFSKGVQRAVAERIAAGRVAFIDFEASSLNDDTFPIEVAWSWPRDGSVASLRIAPPEDWLTEGAWDPAAERVHGISLAELRRTGRPVEEVAAQVMAALDGVILMSDSPPYDSHWMRRLLTRGGVRFDRVPEVAADVREFTQAWAATQGLRPAVVAEIDRMADRLAPMTHAARDDAVHHAFRWQAVMLTAAIRRGGASRSDADLERWIAQHEDEFRRLLPAPAEAPPEEAAAAMRP